MIFTLYEVVLHFYLSSGYLLASLVAQLVKNPPARQETLVQFLGWEDPLKEGMAMHSSILAWNNPHGQRSLAVHSPWGSKSRTRLRNSAQHKPTF